MRILIKHPGQYPELEDIDEADALSALQKIVGGYIELVPITHKIRLVVQADTGGSGAEYKYNTETKEERVYLLTPDGYRSNAVGVNGDSLEAIVRDVFKNL